MAGFLEVTAGSLQEPHMQTDIPSHIAYHLVASFPEVLS